ncbi:MAG: hypothetical protein ACRD3M_00340 [Thermoanaerobaculia bacterium]
MTSPVELARKILWDKHLASGPPFATKDNGSDRAVDTATVYDVTLDQAGMDWQKAGPLFERYAIGLTGRVDRRWADCFAKVTRERPNLARFRLEPAAGQVSFTCRATDGPAEVMGVLKRLEEMIGLVNEAATLAAKAELEQAHSRSRGAASAEPAHGAGALAAGLFARLSRR